MGWGARGGVDRIFFVEELNTAGSAVCGFFGGLLLRTLGGWSGHIREGFMEGMAFSWV